MVLLCCGMANALAAGEPGQEIVNPHWTGRHCAECHLEKDPRVGGAARRFNGDTIALCNRCHELDNVRTDNHPVGVPLLEGMKNAMPEAFPLDSGQLTCLTCHDALLQMYENFVLKQTNRNFIRGAPYEDLSTFCFFCHKQEEYAKTNPHEQLDAKGNINEDRCLFCHQSVPDPVRAMNIEDVSFKTTLSLYCINCHFLQKTGHPAKADHLVPLPDFLKSDVSERAQKQQSKLPLDGDRIFCGTCHNPHAKGVIQRQEAAAGAGEEYFLRLNGGYELCVTCHHDKVVGRSDAVLRNGVIPPGLPQRLISSHKPATENRCKNCHSITSELRDRPPALKLCFKTDCHKTDMLNQEFIHEVSVVENCYLCHLSHSSTHEKLLRMDKQQLCRSCHPLMRDRMDSLTAGSGGSGDTGSTGIRVTPETGAKSRGQDGEGGSVSRAEFEKSSREHTAFVEFLRTTPVPRGNECGFCHSPYHQKEIGKVSIDICSQCHTFVRDILASASKMPLNIHDTFQEKLCTACHDPHAAPYKHVLKEPVETYLPGEVSPAVSSRQPGTTY